MISHTKAQECYQSNRTGTKFRALTCTRSYTQKHDIFRLQSTKMNPFSQKLNQCISTRSGKVFSTADIYNLHLFALCHGNYARKEISNCILCLNTFIYLSQEILLAGSELAAQTFTEHCDLMLLNWQISVSHTCLEFID